MPPWQSSAFRPFHLLGALAAVVLTGGPALAWIGVAPGSFAALHAHEMLFGFSLAVIAGTVLTALPSWAGTAPVQGAALVQLVGLWLLGRAALALAGWLPAFVVAAADLALPLVLMVRIAPQLLRLAERRWLLVLLPLLGLAAANATWHFAQAGGDSALAAAALRGALWAVVVMFSLAGGLFTPAFTANVAAERGRRAPDPASVPLEAAALTLLLALVLADLGAADPRWIGPLATSATLVHALRVIRWRGWTAVHDPLVAAMHLGFAWMLAALALKAAAGFGAPWPEATWVHAFTVGALGTMKITLMTRVALRHTGRPLVAPAELPWLLLLINAAALARLGAALNGGAGMLLAGSRLLLAGAALAWMLAFGLWAGRHVRILLAPSLPRH